MLEKKMTPRRVLPLAAIAAALLLLAGAGGATNAVLHPFLAADALVLPREPLHPGVIVRFRPIGFLKMLDNGEHDEKVIGVPTDKLDPTYAGIRDLQDLPLIERQRIEAFFRVYKDLPEGRNPVQLDGWGNAAEAKALIRASMQRFDLQQQRRKGD